MYKIFKKLKSCQQDKQIITQIFLCFDDESDINWLKSLMLLPKCKDNYGQFLS